MVLSEIIITRIKKEWLWSFKDFMEMALCFPAWVCNDAIKVNGSNIIKLKVISTSKK
jgi:hypothetical protein